MKEVKVLLHRVSRYVSESNDEGYVRIAGELEAEVGGLLAEGWVLVSANVSGYNNVFSAFLTRDKKQEDSG